MKGMLYSRCVEIVVKDEPDVKAISPRGFTSTGRAEILPLSAMHPQRGFLVEPSKSALAKTPFERLAPLMRWLLTSSTRLTGR